eukprot:NODE_335_length_9311_cov_0.760313.p7 type:complete len:271 gc:universal NODE_335_length_9311_cov_0.760313:5224-4412(-)
MISLVHALKMTKTPGNLIQLSASIEGTNGRLCGVGLDHGRYYCKYTSDGGTTWSDYQIKNGFEGVFIAVRGAKACVVGRKHDIRCTDNIDGKPNKDGTTFDVDFSKIDGGKVLQVQMDDQFMCLVNEHSELWCSPFATKDVKWVRIEPAGDGAKSVAVDGGQVCISKEDGIHCGAIGKAVDAKMQLTQKYQFQLDQMTMSGSFLCGTTSDLSKHFIRCVDMSVADKKMESWEGSLDWASVSVTNGFVAGANSGDKPHVFVSTNVTARLAY